mgnify:CR=1 FL=1
MFSDSTYRGIEEMQAAAARHNPFDVSDIPTPDDIARGRTQKAHEDAAKVMDALRKHFAAGGGAGSVTAIGRGVMPHVHSGSLALVNAALAAKGWRLYTKSEQREGQWCELAEVKASP